MTFVYNEETRQHTLNGKHIGSVSQIIAPLNDFSNIPPEKLERKCQLGIEFHKAIDLYLIDDLNFDRLDPDLIKPMTTFIEWWDNGWIKATNFTSEQPICHKTLKYCGKPDLWNDGAIYDFKLRPYKPVTDILQLEGYRHMLPPGKRDRWTVCFDLEGNMKMHRSQHPKAWGIFRRLLERYYSDLEFNNLMTDWKGLN